MTLSMPSQTAAHGLFHIKAPSASAEVDGTEIESTVRDILGRVARDGDDAVRHYSQAFDGTALLVEDDVPDLVPLRNPDERCEGHFPLLLRCLQTRVRLPTGPALTDP